VKSRMVELPLARKIRFMREYRLPSSDAQAFMWNKPLADYFEGIAKESKNPKAIANWVINNLRSKFAEEEGAFLDDLLDPNLLLPGGKMRRQLYVRAPTDLRFKPEALLELINLVENKTISSSAAQQVFAEMFETGKSPAAIVQEKGLAQVSDTSAIEKLCDEAIAANPGPANDFKSGKAAALNFLKGQVMKLSKGKANPAVAGEILERKLKS
jgi:aspartyl-tRNA(Asn)/glutamyl-tRNA(Gln) amidotransferase subunit B